VALSNWQEKVELTFEESKTKTAVVELAGFDGCEIKLVSGGVESGSDDSDSDDAEPPLGEIEGEGVADGEGLGLELGLTNGSRSDATSSVI